MDSWIHFEINASFPECVKIEAMKIELLPPVIFHPTA